MPLLNLDSHLWSSTYSSFLFWSLKSRWFKRSLSRWFFRPSFRLNLGLGRQIGYYLVFKLVLPQIGRCCDDKFCSAKTTLILPRGGGGGGGRETRCIVVYVKMVNGLLRTFSFLKGVYKWILNLHCCSKSTFLNERLCQWTSCNILPRVVAVY